MSAINCAHCGAPLDAPDSARFVTCRHCGSSLEVKRTQSAEWTETLGKVAAETERLREDVEAIRAGQEIERLDREWEMRQRDLMERGEEGRTYRPTQGKAVAMAVMLLVFGIVGLFMFSSLSRASRHVGFGHVPGIAMSGDFGNPPKLPGVVVVFILLMVVAGGVAVVRTFAKAEKFDSEEKEYQSRREELLRRRQGR